MTIIFTDLVFEKRHQSKTTVQDQNHITRVAILH